MKSIIYRSVEMIRYNTYDAHSNNGWIYMNWVGKYTYGSIFFRGTRIGLQENCGMFLTTYENEDSSVSLEDGVMFWNDSVMWCVESIDEFLNTESSSEEIEEIEEISIDNLDKLLASEKPWEENPGVCMNRLEETKRLVSENRGDIEACDKIYIRGELVTIVHKFKEMIEELEEVNKIAKENNVTFFWV
jgi:hypothetical protein